MGQFLKSCVSLAASAFFTAICVPAATAQGIDANKLIGICDGEFETADALCKMYVWGTIEGLQFGADAAAYNSGFTQDSAMRAQAQVLLGVCDPETVTRGQQFEVVMKYIRNNPQSWHRPSVILIHRALMDAFPCH